MSKVSGVVHKIRFESDKIQTNWNNYANFSAELIIIMKHTPRIQPLGQFKAALQTDSGVCRAVSVWMTEQYNED